MVYWWYLLHSHSIIQCMYNKKIHDARCSYVCLQIHQKASRETVNDISWVHWAKVYRPFSCCLTMPNKNLKNTKYKNERKEENPGRSFSHLAMQSHPRTLSRYKCDVRYLLSHHKRIQTHCTLHYTAEMCVYRSHFLRTSQTEIKIKTQHNKIKHPIRYKNF